MKRKKKSFFQKITLGLILSLGFFALSGVARAEDVESSNNPVPIEAIEKKIQEENISGESTNPMKSGMREATKEEIEVFFKSSNPEVALGFDSPKSTNPELAISIENLKIVSQNNNLLKISFDAVNGNPYSRNEIMYGVLLNKKSETSEDLPYYGEARQFYPEKIFFDVNTRISRTIEYTAPDYLSGEYLLSVELYKDNGLYLGGQQLDDPIKLEGINNILEIVPSSCTIEVGEGENGRSYSPNGEASLNPQEEKVIGICQVINHSDKQITFTQSSKIYRESILKSQSPLIQNNDSTFQFEPKEESLIFFPLPTDLDPQIYDVEVFLKDGKEIISNSTIVRYLLQGASVAIWDIIFDSSFFLEGENIPAFLNIFFYPGQSEEEKSLDCDLIIKDKTDGQICGQTSQELTADEEEFEEVKNLNYMISHSYDLEFSVPISKECKNPIASVIAKDKNGKILAQEEIEIVQETDQESLIKEKNKIALVILFLVSILILVILLFILKRKK
jgi:hypothetical protein